MSPHEKRELGVGAVHIHLHEKRKTEIRYRGRNVSTRCAVFRLPRRGRSQTGPPDPASPFLRPRRGGPCGRPPRRTRHSLPFVPVGAALAAARRFQVYLSPSARPDSPRPLGTYPDPGRGPSVSAS